MTVLVKIIVGFIAGIFSDSAIEESCNVSLENAQEIVIVNTQITQCEHTCYLFIKNT